MKKILVISLTLVLAVCGAQAQTKNTGKVPARNVNTTATKGDGTTKVAGTKVLKIMELPNPEVGLDAPLQKAFSSRATIRDIREEDLPIELLSSLLWSAYGINRPEETKRVVPSAVNVQEFDIYLFTREGIYIYNAEKNNICLLLEGDHRAEISSQKHFAVAPVSIVMVANYDRMKVFKSEEDRDFYAAVDAGYISQNIYLFCASADLATVACGGIDRDTIHKILGIKNGKAILAHPVGLNH